MDFVSIVAQYQKIPVYIVVFLELLLYFHFSSMDVSLEDSPVNRLDVDIRNFSLQQNTDTLALG